MSHFFSLTLGWNITWTYFHAFYPSPSELTFSSSNVPFLVDMKEERPGKYMRWQKITERIECIEFAINVRPLKNDIARALIIPRGQLLCYFCLVMFSCACSAEREGRTLHFYSELWTALSFSLPTFPLPFFSTKIALIKDNGALKEIVIKPLGLQKSWIQYVHHFLIQHQIYCV